MKWIIFICVFLVLFISLVSGVCDEGQIDINTANAEELDKLAGIGEVKSQAIIDSRPFDSVDDLIDVYGIGETTLKNIKEQGLACVEDEESSESLEENGEDSEKDNTELIEDSNDFVEDSIINDEENVSKTNEVLVLKNENVINLNQPKENKEIIYESKNERIKNYVIYGFALFLIFVILVLLIRS